MGLKIETLQRMDLGIQGEHNATVIRIDCNGWKQQFPNGVITILHKRKGDEDLGVTGASYDSETGILTWSVTDQDTFYSGEGMAEIRLTEGTVVKKKKKALTLVRPTVVNDVGDELGSNWQAYIDEVERVKSMLGSQAEAWATGNRNGVPVTDPDDPVYENNSKYYVDSLAERIAEFIQRIEQAEQFIPDDLDYFASVQSVTERLAAFGYVDGTTLILEEPDGN